MRAERALLSLVLLAAVGCTVPPEKTTIPLNQPAAVTFFPNLAHGGTSTEIDIETAYDHLQNTRAALEECLRGTGVTVSIVSADDLILGSGAGSTVIPLHGVTDANIGCLFVAPNQEPKIIRATSGPRMLPFECPAAAAAYFSVPRCCPDGMQCR